MKLFSVFSKSKGSDANGKTPSKKAELDPDATVSTSADLSMRSSTRSRRSKRHSKRKSKRNAAEKGSEASKQLCKIAEDCVNAWNAYIPEDRTAYLEQLMSFFQSEDTPIILEDGEKYVPEACNQLFDITFQSFPDFHMSFSEVKEMGPNKVLLDGLSATGTHKGAPYSIMPGALPAVAPSGKYIANDEQRLIFHFDDNQKIEKLEVIALGAHTGFVGFYTLAGGDLSALQQPKE